MFTVKIINKSKNQKLEEKKLTGITADSTGYEYGAAVADAIEEYVKRRCGVLVEIDDPDGHTIHKLAIVPKGGTIMVTENGAGTLPLTYEFRESDSLLPEKYLIMVNPDKNNNKFYRMVDLGNHRWGAFYGRIGEKQGESVYSSHVTRPHEYPDYMYYIKLQEKLLKGYKDKTQCHKTGGIKVHKPVDFIDIDNPKVSGLISKLMFFAKKTIEQHYTVLSADVTVQMVNEAKKELKALRRMKTPEAFNKHLLELMSG